MTTDDKVREADRATLERWRKELERGSAAVQVTVSEKFLLSVVNAALSAATEGDAPPPAGRSTIPVSYAEQARREGFIQGKAAGMRHAAEQISSDKHGVHAAARRDFAQRLRDEASEYVVRENEALERRLSTPPPEPKPDATGGEALLKQLSGLRAQLEGMSPVADVSVLVKTLTALFAAAERGQAATAELERVRGERDELAEHKEAMEAEALASRRERVAAEAKAKEAERGRDEWKGVASRMTVRLSDAARRIANAERWEAGFRSIVTILVGARAEFEIGDIVEKVRAAAAAERRIAEAVAIVTERVRETERQGGQTTTRDALTYWRTRQQEAEMILRQLSALTPPAGTEVEG